MAGPLGAAAFLADTAAAASRFARSDENNRRAMGFSAGITLGSAGLFILPLSVDDEANDDEADDDEGVINRALTLDGRLRGVVLGSGVTERREGQSNLGRTVGSGENSG